MFIAVAEEGSLTAAARRLHISQPALSQAMVALERRLALGLLIRGRAGIALTDAGNTLLTESRAVLARYDQALATLSRHDAPEGVLRLGIPLELPPDLLSSPLATLGRAYPDTRVQARHATTAQQITALRGAELDVGLVRERPTGTDLDATLVCEEQLGVLLARSRADTVATTRGVHLDGLAGLDWVGFPRSGSPAWFDELTAILRSHGVSPGDDVRTSEPLIAEVKMAAVTSGHAFALVPPHWSHPMPDEVSWYPLIGSPLIRRTWAAWRSESRRLDVALFVNALEADG